MCCTWEPNNTVHLEGSSLLYGKSSYLWNQYGSGVPAPALGLGDCVCSYTTQQNVRNNEDASQHRRGVGQGKCVATEGLTGAVMIPPGFKRAHLTFNFNESLLGKSHRGVGVVVTEWQPKPCKATRSKGRLNHVQRHVSLWLTVSLSEMALGNSLFALRIFLYEPLRHITPKSGDRWKLLQAITEGLLTYL